MRTFASLFILLLSITSVSCQNKDNNKNNFDASQLIDSLQWIQQACFKITLDGLTIYTDPYQLKFDDKADIILITHPHGDHFDTTQISKIATQNTVVIGPAECKYTKDIKQFIEFLPGKEYKYSENIVIKAVPAYNVVKSNFHAKNKNWIGYLISYKGITIYHAGDTERIPEMQNFTADIALVPLGQKYTMNSVEEAAESVKDVKAKYAIPMHYGLYEGSDEDALKFKTLLEPGIKVIIKPRQ